MREFFFLYLFWQRCSYSFENGTKISSWRTNNRFTPMQAGIKILCVLKCSQWEKNSFYSLRINYVPRCETGIKGTKLKNEEKLKQAIVTIA